MKRSSYAIGAAALSVLLVSTSAFAFCQAEQSLNGDSGSAECADEDDFGNVVVLRTGEGLDYTYVVTGILLEEEAGGVLLDETGSVVFGDRADGTNGPCNVSFSVDGGGSVESVTFTCNNASAPVASVRVFAE